MNVNELIKNMSDAFAATASVKSVYGDPITVGEKIVVPVAEVRYGFGAGGGAKKDESGSGSGGGGGVMAMPSGALEITPGGTRFIPFDDRPKLARALAAGVALGALLAVLTRKPRS
jgi:uncharacterized spore protein YtfJ